MFRLLLSFRIHRCCFPSSPFPPKKKSPCTHTHRKTASLSIIIAGRTQHLFRLLCSFLSSCSSFVHRRPFCPLGARNSQPPPRRRTHMHKCVYRSRRQHHCATTHDVRASLAWWRCSSQGCSRTRAGRAVRTSTPSASASLFLATRPTWMR